MKINKSAVSAVKQRRDFSMAQDYKNTKYDPTMLQINLLVNNSKMTLSTIAHKCGVTIQCYVIGEGRKHGVPRASQ
jgi:hypothetical protein